MDHDSDAAPALAMTLYAWVGPDETGREAGHGIKQAICPAGIIPMVSCRAGVLEQDYILGQMQQQAARHGVTIRLVRFVAEAVVVAMPPGPEAP